MEILRGGPEGIVVAMAIRLVVRRRSPDEHSTNTYFAAAFEFRHRCPDVCEFDGAETDEPLRIVTGILGGPVVDPAKACGAKLGVVEAEQQHPHRGVHRLGVDAVAILLLEALRWIPHALGGGVETALMCSGSSSAVLPEPKKPATCIGSI